MSAAQPSRWRRFRKIRKALVLLGRRKFRHGLYHGVAATIEHQGALGSLEVRTVVDIGANVGQFSLLASELFPAATIYAFEPLHGPAETYLKLFPPGSEARLFRAAIGSKSGEAEMHVSRRHDSSSLLPISADMARIFPGTEEVGRERVVVEPLASFLSVAEIAAPALVKIDVQGAELDVLKGFGALLREFRYVYVELSFVPLYTGQPLADEIIAFLRADGFHLRGVHNLSVDGEGRAIQADFLFVRDDAPARA